jgi:acetyl esterase
MGGGWILGNKDTHDRLIREFADGAHAAVVFVNYTPSHEAHYPTSIEEAYAATRYVAENGASMGLDPSRLAVAGDSVGGNMVAAVTILAKQRGTPQDRASADVLSSYGRELRHRDVSPVRRWAVAHP